MKPTAKIVAYWAYASGGHWPSWSAWKSSLRVGSFRYRSNALAFCNAHTVEDEHGLFWQKRFVEKARDDPGQ